MSQGSGIRRLAEPFVRPPWPSAYSVKWEQQYLPRLRRYFGCSSSLIMSCLRGQGFVSYGPGLESSVHLSPAALLSHGVRRAPHLGACEDSSEHPAHAETQNRNHSQNERAVCTAAHVVRVGGGAGGGGPVLVTPPSLPSSLPSFRQALLSSRYASRAPGFPGECADPGSALL